MRKAAPSAGNRNAAVLSTTEITLEDGTKIPIKIPEGMPPVQAQALLAYLQSNPEAAKAAAAQAQNMLRTPGMAQAMLNMRNNTVPNTPENAEKMAKLKEDPEIAKIFEDVAQNGPGAFQKYWDDEDLMAKMSAKMKELGLQPPTPQGARTPSKQPASDEISSLFDAAKWGDVEAATRLIEEGKDVNAKNDKDVSALGIAVGFNRINIVKLLLEKGADVMLADGKGNTVLHYAAGYGRKEAAEVLLAAGAKLDAKNEAKQTPIDVAKQNREKEMVEFLKAKKHDE